MNRQFPEQLAERLAEPSPGFAAQGEMAPALAYGRHAGPAPWSARSAAVVALVYPHEDRWRLPLTLRPKHLPDHAGQISLPGGVVEPGESSREAALRELEEELGVSIDEVRLLGSLSNVYVFNSNYDVAVHVAAAVVRPRFRPSRDEVAELLEIPINELADPRSVRVVMHERRSLRFQTPGYQWRERHVWGATAMILAELLAVIRPLQL